MVNGKFLAGVAVIVITAVCFAVPYAVLMRQEVRPIARQGTGANANVLRMTSRSTSAVRPFSATVAPSYRSAANTSLTNP